MQKDILIKNQIIVLFFLSRNVPLDIARNRIVAFANVFSAKRIESDDDLQSVDMSQFDKISISQIVIS